MLEFAFDNIWQDDSNCSQMLYLVCNDGMTLGWYSYKETILFVQLNKFPNFCD